MKFSCLPTITTSEDSRRKKIWAPDNSARPKSSLVTTSKSIIVRARLTGLLMPYLNTFGKVQRKTRLFVQRTSRFCIGCSPGWPEYLAFQSTQTNSLLSIRSSYMEQLSFPSWTSFETYYEPNWMRKGLTKLASVLCVWGFRSYKKQTRRPKKLELQSCRMNGSRSTGLYTTKGSLMCQKSFAPSSSASTTMIHL